MSQRTRRHEHVVCTTAPPLHHGSGLQLKLHVCKTASAQQKVTDGTLASRVHDVQVKCRDNSKGQFDLHYM